MSYFQIDSNSSSLDQSQKSDATSQEDTDAWKKELESQQEIYKLLMQEMAAIDTDAPIPFSTESAAMMDTPKASPRPHHINVQAGINTTQFSESKQENTNYADVQSLKNQAAKGPDA